MRIAQVSPLFESVPPRLYGGTERIVYNLTEALVRMGHDVTLFASGDSCTSAELRAVCPRALRLEGVRETLAPHTLMLEMVRDEASSFDLIHFHTEYMHLNLIRSLHVPCVSTMHGRLDLPEYHDLFREFSDAPLVSISMHQRKPLAFANWTGMVHHGLEAGLLPYNEKTDGYLAFLGRVSPEKGFHHAVEIARRTGMRLKVAAKIEALDSDYYREVRHLFAEPFVEYIGEIGDAEKPEFLGGASALLFPIEWPEPFGLVMIEALASGTPVIAFRHGSVPEIIRDGVSGFIVDSVEEACEAVQAIPLIKRARCRQEFDERFTVDRMAQDYEQIYEKICEQRKYQPARSLLRVRQASLAFETTGGIF